MLPKIDKAGTQQMVANQIVEEHFYMLVGLDQHDNTPMYSEIILICGPVSFFLLEDANDGSMVLFFWEPRA